MAHSTTTETVNLQKRELRDLHSSLLRFLEVLERTAHSLYLERLVTDLAFLAILLCSHTRNICDRLATARLSPRSATFGGPAPSSTHVRATLTSHLPFRLATNIPCSLSAAFRWSHHSFIDLQDHNTLVPFADFLNHANVDVRWPPRAIHADPAAAA